MIIQLTKGTAGTRTQLSELLARPLALQDPNKHGDPGTKHELFFYLLNFFNQIHFQWASRISVQVVMTKPATQILILFSNIFVPWFLSEELGPYDTI